VLFLLFNIYEYCLAVFQLTTPFFLLLDLSFGVVLIRLLGFSPNYAVTSNYESIAVLEKIVSAFPYIPK
jgi:hypothetical protein